MLAYLSWHRPAAGTDIERYEQTLVQFHRSLAHQPPSGLRGSASYRAPRLPWLGEAATAAADLPGDYEDWYLLDDWSALGVLEEAAIAHGHRSAHERVAALSGTATAAVYRLTEGHCDLSAVRVAVWVTHTRGRRHPSLESLLGDGMDPRHAGLWRRCVGLGPAPEHCLLAPEAPAGVASSRLPSGWQATVGTRAVLWPSKDGQGT